MREFRLRRIFLLAAIVSELPSRCSQNANPALFASKKCRGDVNTNDQNTKGIAHAMPFVFW
jgi:hypothetical protein